MEAKAVVMIGGKGGDTGLQAAKRIKTNCSKPSSAIAGGTAPKGRTMAHAGAVVPSADESTVAKKKVTRERGIAAVDSPETVWAMVKEVLGQACSRAGSPTGSSRFCSGSSDSSGQKADCLGNFVTRHDE